MPVGELLSTTFEGFIQDTDPGAVGPDMLWVNRTTGAAQFRNASNLAWVALTVGGGGGTGTVTNSAGALTANQLVIGNGGVDLKVAPAITASKALVSDVNGIPIASVTTAAELAFVSGATSNIQAQINALGGGGSPSFTNITGGTNITAAMVVGTGASLATSGSGTIVATSLSATLAANKGGTGMSVYVIGDLLYANTTSTLAALAGVAAGSTLRSTGVGTAPTWSAVTTPNSATTGDIVYASASNTYSNLAAVSAGQLLVSQGVGVAPAWQSSLTSLTLTQGTITSDAQQLSGTVTWNNAGIVGPAWKLVVTDTSSNANATFLEFFTGATQRFAFVKSGMFQFGSNKHQIRDSGILAIDIFFNNGGTQACQISNIGLTVTGGQLGLTSDLFMRRTAAATLQFGAADVNGAAVAQTTQVQSAITGTDQNGADWTFIGSKQTGAGTPGNIIFKTSPKLASGTTQGTPETGLTITGPPLNMHPSVVIGNQALATTATDGFLYIPTCAGTPTGVPTAFTGRVAIIYDTTNNKIAVYNGAWKQTAALT